MVTAACRSRIRLMRCHSHWIAGFPDFGKGKSLNHNKWNWKLGLWGRLGTIKNGNTRLEFFFTFASRFGFLYCI